MADNPMIGVFDENMGEYFYLTNEYAPSEYAVKPEEIFKGERTVSGTLMGDFITSKDTITIRIKGLPKDGVKRLVELTSMKFFSVLYYQPHTMNFRASIFYRGNDITITPITQWKDPDFDRYEVTISMVEK